MHPRMYVGGMGERGGGWDGRNGPLPRARVALLCHWASKGGGGRRRGKRKGSTFVHVRLKFSVGFE